MLFCGRHFKTVNRIDLNIINKLHYNTNIIFLKNYYTVFNKTMVPRREAKNFKMYSYVDRKLIL